MAKVEKFEDLICWQKARQLVNEVYKFFTAETCKNDFRYQGQIRAAAVSSMTNIAEGFNRFHKKSFIRFLDISQSSAAEVQSLLYVAIDQKYINQNEFKTIYNFALELVKLNLGLIKHLNSKLESEHTKVKEPEFEYSENMINIWNLSNEFISRSNNNVVTL